MGLSKSEMISEIERLKKEKNAIVLVHNYQLPEIQEIADVLGDSLDLSRIARDTEKETIVFCGVKFMAETAKILSPNKRVLLPAKNAGCPMADTITHEQLQKFKDDHPGYKVVAYVNTTAETKTLTDVCCTSANAVSVVKNYPHDKLLFVPDRNLGKYIQERVPEKEMIVWDGACRVHDRITYDQVVNAKEMYPNAIVLVHPETPKDVVEICDHALSTNQMVNFVKDSDNEEFIIVTETGMSYRMQQENPTKKFYDPTNPAVCINMKKTTLRHVYEALRDDKNEINLSQEVIDKSTACLDEMLKYV